MKAQPFIHYAPETCAFCNGNGSGRCKDGNLYDYCPVCKGIGTILVAQVAKKCAFCSGGGSGMCKDGYVYDRCPVCNGTGWAYVYNEEDDSKTP
jgi:DnaJ-class molecular chaperone